MIQPRKSYSLKLSWRLFLASSALLALTFVFCVFPLKNYDIFWHIKAGDLIRATRTLPTHDIFSFTTPNLKWELNSWGSDLIFSTVYRYFGRESGIIVFKALIMTLAYGLILLTLKKQNRRSIMLLPGFWLFSLMVGKESYLARPQIFSYLFLALFYFLLDYYRRATAKADFRLLLFFPLIMGVWSNLHPGFAVGYLFLFVFLITESIKYGLRNVIYDKWGIERLLTGSKLLWLWLVFPLVILATAANPFGVKTLLAPLRLFLPGAQTNWILEWSAPGIIDEPVFFAAFFLFSAIFLVSFFRLDLSDLGMIVLVSVMSLEARRCISDYAIIILPLSYRYLDIVIWKLKGKKANTANRFFMLGGSSQPLLATAFTLGVIIGLIYFGGGLKTRMNPDRYPQYAADFIINNNIRGNLFNTYRWGGYLIHRLYPRVKVFVDGRLLSRRVFKDYVDVARVSPDGRRILDLYGVNIVLTSYWYETGQRYYLNDDLQRSPDWVRVFDDNKSLVFLRNIPEFKLLIDKYAPYYRRQLRMRSPHRIPTG